MIRNIKALKQVMNDYKLPREELNKLINKRLKNVLASAYQNVPYYRNLMKELDYNPVKDYKGTEDLKLLPVINKRMIKRTGVENFITEGIDYKKCFTDSTSGSSGVPFKVYRLPDERALQIAKWLRVLFVNGYKITDKVLSFTSPHRLDAGKSIIQKFGLLRRHAVDFTLSPSLLTAEFIKYSPQIMYGNRSHLNLIANQLLKEKINPADWGFKLLVVTADVLRENDRKLYKEAFGLDVIDSYGSVEMGVMAFETPAHDGFKLSQDLTFFEFLDKDNNPANEGDLCRIVVTDLSGKLMPFIRYDHSDWVVYKKLNNGEKRIIEIKGRDDDYLTMPDGSIKTYHSFANVMGGYENIFEYRFIQRKINEVELYLVADKDYTAKHEDEIINKLKNATSRDIHYKIIVLEEMFPDKSGKVRKVISEVTSAEKTA